MLILLLNMAAHKNAKVLRKLTRISLYDAFIPFACFSCFCCLKFQRANSGCDLERTLRLRILICKEIEINN